MIPIDHKIAPKNKNVNVFQVHDSVSLVTPKGLTHACDYHSPPIRQWKCSSLIQEIGQTLTSSLQQEVFLVGSAGRATVVPARFKSGQHCVQLRNSNFNLTVWNRTTVASYSSRVFVLKSTERFAWKITTCTSWSSEFHCKWDVSGLNMPLQSLMQRGNEPLAAKVLQSRSCGVHGWGTEGLHSGKPGY